MEKARRKSWKEKLEGKAGRKPANPVFTSSCPFYFFLPFVTPVGASVVDERPILLGALSAIGALSTGLLWFACGSFVDAVSPPQPTRKAAAEQTRMDVIVFMMEI